MKTAELVADELSSLDDFVTRVRQAKEPRSEARDIASLVEFAQRFYSGFFSEHYDLDVNGFGYRDKRRVARRLELEEDRAARMNEPTYALTTLDLAGMFENLSDLFHGEIEFGYSSDDEDYEEFHLYVFPEWLEELTRWLKAASESRVAGELERFARRYEDVIAQVF